MPEVNNVLGKLLSIRSSSHFVIWHVPAGKQRKHFSRLSCVSEERSYTFLELTKLVYSSFFMAATWDLEILHDDNLHCALHFLNVKVTCFMKGNWSSVCELISLFFIAPLNLKERPLYLEFSCCGFYFILYKYINERGKILSIWVPHTVCEICLPSTIYVCKANVKLYLKSALSNSSMHKLYNVSIRPFLFSPAFNWKWTLLFPAPRGGLQTWLQPWKTQCSAEVVMCVFLAAIFSCSTC